MTVEEGGILNGHMERLEELYQHGIRLMTPVWNYENCIGWNIPGYNGNRKRNGDCVSF